MVHFVGAGPGAEDLITIRGKELISRADVIIYAGSLVNPGLLKYAKEGCIIHDSAYLTLDEVIKIMKDADASGFDIVRLHTGDPSIYGAVREQMDELKKLGIGYDSTPGVSSFNAAAAALDLEYTLPGISQSIVITRMEGRTPVPEKESVEALASHGSTMVFFLSSGDLKGLSERLIKAGRPEDTPCALVYKASWEDEKKVICDIGSLAEAGKKEGIDRTALVIVGDVVSTSDYERSKLYSADFATGYRDRKVSEGDGE